MTVDLLFWKLPSVTPGAVDLVFGDDLPVVVCNATVGVTLPGLSVSARLVRPNDATATATLPSLTAAVDGDFLPSLIYDATVGVTLPGLSASARLVRPNDAVLTAALPGLAVTATAAFNGNAERPVVGHGVHRHQDAAPGTVGVSQRGGKALGCRAGAPSAHAKANPLPAGVAAPQRVADRLRGSVRPTASAASPLRQGLSVRHQDALHDRRAATRTTHAGAEPRRASALATHQDRYRDRRPATAVPHQTALPVVAARVSAAGSATQLVLARRRLRHQDARRPPAGAYRSPVTPPVDPCYVPSAHLVFFDTTHGTELVFVCERAGLPGPVATLVIPVRRSYVVTNNLSLRRASDNAPIAAESVTLSLDVDSWTWAFSADVAGDVLPLVEPAAGVPTGLIASVNGMEFFVLAESLSRNRTFGRAELSVRGRGRNAVLAAPYAPARTFNNVGGVQTAEQLALDALSDNGVPVGWGLTWGLDDWLVPAGAWVHQGTPIEALLAIAAAVGGYLQPHPTAQTMAVRHRYPALPRDWAGLTPDVELPSAVVSVEGIEWLDKPGFNRVFVQGGQIGGQLGQVTLAGTAGDLAAPMAVDPLLTDVPALRQRGRAILGDTGRQARVSLRVPALAEMGLVDPGKLVRYLDGPTTRLGLVRSVKIEASHAAAWQTLGVETHV